MSILNSTAIEVTWLPPTIEERNGIIHHYVIAVYESGFGDILSFWGESSEDSSPAVVSLLHPFYQYEMRITAVTVEPGPFSTFISWTMPEDGNDIAV